MPVIRNPAASHPIEANRLAMRGPFSIRGRAMARAYVTLRRIRSADIDENTDGESYLARTVYEDHELIDIGIMDKNGDPIMAHRKPDAVGFIRWRNG